MRAYRHVGAAERGTIRRLSAEGFSVRAIARMTGRHFSTVSRVLLAARSAPVGINYLQRDADRIDSQLQTIEVFS